MCTRSKEAVSKEAALVFNVTTKIVIELLLGPLYIGHGKQIIPMFS